MFFCSVHRIFVVMLRDFRRKLALELAHCIDNEVNRKHVLRQLFWECTLRCNLHCRHCGSDCRAQALVQDMPKEDFFGVLDNIAKHMNPREVFVMVTGGEPLLRTDLEECGRGFMERGYPWGLITNGLLLTESKLEALYKVGLQSVAMSLDGLETNHDWMRGHPGSFVAAERAIEAMVKLKAQSSKLKTQTFTFDVVTCVNQRNFDELKAIKDFIVRKGVRAWRIYMVVPMGRAKDDPEMRLSKEQLRGVFDFIKKTRKEGMIDVAYGCEGFLGKYEGEVRDTFFHCEAGISVGSVMADGSIAACASIRSNYNQGNIYQDDFMEVWEKGFIPHRTYKWRKTGGCKDCKHFRYCRGNGMHLRDENGNLIQCILQEMC